MLRPEPPSAHRLVRGLLRASLLAVVFALAWQVPGTREAAAKAPPHATAVVDTSVYTTPDVFGEPVGTLPSGSEVELTGGAAPGFLAVYYGDGVVWVPSQFLALSERPGIDTAVATVDTPLLEAPMRDAGVVTNVPEGASVILTGASVDVYDAASYDGAGGWIDERDIAR